MSVRFGYVTPTKMAIYGNVCEFVVTLMVIIILVMAMAVRIVIVIAIMLAKHVNHQ